MSQLNRVFNWFKSFTAPAIAPATESASTLPYDPAWHGDHWQNLLSSPMDARRYVMEDWAIPLDADVVTRDEQATA
jgi:hypothetical protein